jgi:Fe-S-cluster containining protein
MGLEGRAEAYFREIDKKVVEAVGRLAASGRRPPCGPGCRWCCYLPVRASAPEASLIAAYLDSNLMKDGLILLKQRVEAWLRWHREELPRHVTGPDVSRAYLLHGPSCPFLKGGLCGIYPVRPMGCRVHFSYDAIKCGPDAPPASIFDPPHIVQDILDAVRPLCLEYRMDIQDAGIDFEGSLRLLPELLLDICA